MQKKNTWIQKKQNTKKKAGLSKNSNEITTNTSSNNVSDEKLETLEDRKRKAMINQGKEIKIMKKLISMRKKNRTIYFKQHKNDLKLWRRFLELEEITPKLLACIFRGISYAFPFADLNIQIFKSDLDIIYKLALKCNMKIALMALQFTFRVESTPEQKYGTNITDQTPRNIVKMDRSEDFKKSKSGKITPSDRFYDILYKMSISRWRGGGGER